MTTSAQQSSGSTLPTTGVNMAMASTSTASASINAMLYLAMVYSQAMTLYADQLNDYFALQMDDAKASAQETREAGLDQMWASISQGAGQIAQGGLSIAGGYQGMKGVKETESNINNANEYRNTLEERINNGTNTTLRDEMIYGRTNSRDIEMLTPEEQLMRGTDITNQSNILVNKMKQSNYHFGEKVSLEQKNAIFTANNQDAVVMRENVDEYIKNQQAKQAQPNSQALIYNGIGTLIAGGCTIAGGVMQNEEAKHNAKKAVWDASENAASSMLNNAQQQWNSVVSNLNQVYQMILQIAQANKVQG